MVLGYINLASFSFTIEDDHGEGRQDSDVQLSQKNIVITERNSMDKIGKFKEFVGNKEGPWERNA